MYGSFDLILQNGSSVLIFVCSCIKIYLYFGISIQIIYKLLLGMIRLMLPSPVALRRQLTASPPISHPCLITARRQDGLWGGGG